MRSGTLRRMGWVNDRSGWPGGSEYMSIPLTRFVTINKWLSAAIVAWPLVYFHQIKKYGMLCLRTFVSVTGTTTTWSKAKPDMQLYRAKTEMSLERRC